MITLVRSSDYITIHILTWSYIFGVIIHDHIKGPNFQPVIDQTLRDLITPL